jgi:hypothetical protein
VSFALVALVVCFFVGSLFCLGCVKSLPLPKWTETFLIQVVLLFAFVLAFDLLFQILWSFLFFFLFSLVTKCNALINGEIGDLCGSRIGGWLVPSVMSD